MERWLPGNFSDLYLLMMRHYYDVSQLLDLVRVQKFIGADEYENYKEERFRAGDNTKISDNEAFRLSD